MLSHLIIKLFPCILDQTFSGQQCWWPWPLRLQGVPLNSPIKSSWDQKVVRLGDQRGVLEPWLGANAISSHTFMHTQNKTHICIHILTHTVQQLMKHQATSHLTTHNPSPMKKRRYFSRTHSIHLLVVWSRNQLHDDRIITDKPLSHAFGFWKEQKAWERETLSASTENLTKEP